MQEVWKDVSGYEGLYQVSTLGRVKTLGCVREYSDGRVYNYPEKILKQSNSRGYTTVHFYRDGKRSHGQSVHRLVVDAFLPNPENKVTVNHINGIKSDNRLENLEWATYKENNNHAYSVGLHKGTPTGYHSKLSKLTKEAREDILLNCKKGVAGATCKLFADKYGVSEPTIHSLVNRGLLEYKAEYKVL